jgi:chromosome segregation ATPase
MPGDTVSVSVQATPKSSSVYLQNLTATVYYADTAGLHLIATQTLASNPANGYGFYSTGSFNKTFTVSVPQNASRTSLFAVFSETVRLNYYALYYGYAPYYCYGCLPPYYSYRGRTDDAIAPLSYIEATTPEYVSLQSQYQTLQRQLNQTQLKQSQLQDMVVQENATINQLNQQLASVSRTTETYQLLALGFGILAVILAVFSIYEWKTKEKTRKAAETSISTSRRDLEEKLLQSSAKVDELQVKLSNSVPRAELETTRSELQSRITDLEGKLASSVPRTEADELRARVAQLQEELSGSVSKTEADALGKKANDLEAALTETSGRLSSAETRIRELESKLAESISKADAEARIAELQARLSESKNGLDALKEKLAGLESRTAEAERDLEAAKNRIKDLEASAVKP